MKPARAFTASPKRRTTRSPEFSDWFDYYAGYSPRFVTDVLDSLQLRAGQRVLDPWNGAGTTTFVASQRGVVATGFDINPAMVVVGKARLLGGEVKQSLKSLAKELLADSARLSDRLDVDDPLRVWFYPAAASRLRSIERTICRALADQFDARKSCSPKALENLSSLAAFYYVAAFRTARRLLKPFRTTNPTWTSVPKEQSARLRPTREVLEANFLAEVDSM